VFFKLVTDARGSFPPTLQERIDEYFTTLKTKQQEIPKSDTFKRNAGWTHWAV
jgi:hypothetical protein